MSPWKAVNWPGFTLLPVLVSWLVIVSQCQTKGAVRAWPRQQLTETQSSSADSAPGAVVEASFLGVSANETTRVSSGLARVTHALEADSAVDSRENRDKDTLAKHTAAPASTLFGLRSDGSGGGHPGARDYFASSSDVEVHRVSLKDCTGNGSTIYGTEGVVLSLQSNKDSLRQGPADDYSCEWRIVVPEGRYVVLTADILGSGGHCKSKSGLLISTWEPESEDPSLFSGRPFLLRCAVLLSKSPTFFRRSRAIQFSVLSYFGINLAAALQDRSDIPTDLPDFKVVFSSTTEQLWTQMSPVFTSPASGFMTSPGFDAIRPYGPFLDASYNLSIPEEHVVMVSFPYFALIDLPGHFVKLSVVNRDDVVEEEHSHAKTQYIPPYVFHSATVVVQFVSRNIDNYAELARGMNLSFSFHPVTAAPRRLDSGLFDCSVSAHYASFEQHVHCNLEPECEGGEDEGGHCPFSSPACRGWVEAGGKCFFPVDSDGALSWEAAQRGCERRGGDLAMMKTPEEWEAFWKLYDYGRNWKCVYIGLKLNHTSLTRMYGKTWIWQDATAAFDVSVTSDEAMSWDSNVRNPAVMVLDRLLVSLDRDKASPCSRYVCQVESNGSRLEADSFRFSNNDSLSSVDPQGLDIVRCPAGHFTRTFLRCYTKSMCGVQEFQPHCELTRQETSSSHNSSSSSSSFSSSGSPASSSSISASSSPSGSAAFSSRAGDEESVGLFECDNEMATLPYTLVCDFIHDCSDRSDEAFCKHDKCELMFQCDNGQCFAIDQQCDRIEDCWDGSDEENCPYFPNIRTQFDFIYQKKVQAPSVIEFTNGGAYVQKPISSADGCPRGYFRCPSSVHCLPIYLRCNGVFDCPRHEDEVECNDYACPGLYRCRGTSACLLVDHLCDGLAQCPWRDDELLCEATCPPTCRCQGLAFVCHRPFQADDFPQLRYLDASGSGMALDDLVVNKYLVYVKLASCGLHDIARASLPNLLYLDLSRNALGYIDIDVFLSLTQLRTLNLRDNPLALLTGGASRERHLHLRLVDLSRTDIAVLSGEPFKGFPSIQTINASFSKVRAIAEEGFQSTPALSQLDLRGNRIDRYPRNVFKSLPNIKYIYADDYKLCCPGMLPEGYKDFCFAPQDEISSCQDLLRSQIYRTFLWFMCIASVVGNVGCFFFRNRILKSKPASGFNVFVSNLSVADCLMGVYLVFIGAADQMYRGNYYRYENVWTSSVPCTVSGFVSLLSSEVSAFTICLITLDRFVVLRFPFSTLRFERRSAVYACLLAWVLGVSLAVIPLLVPQWQFYSYTGICVPLPVTRKDFGGQEYSFGVIIVFNFVLFMVIAAGQGFIYYSVMINALTVNTTKKLQDLTVARRLITVAVSDFLCWFPVGLLGILASVGVPVPGEVSVALAIFVLPLNSALNPFLYTFNVLMERRRKEREARLLKWLEVTAERAGTSTDGELSVSKISVLAPEHGAIVVTDTKQEILQRLRAVLESELVSCQELRAFLSSLQKNAD